MSTISTFKSAARIKHESNLQQYIATAQAQHNVWKDLPGFDWQASVWPTLRGNLSFHKFSPKPDADNIYEATSEPFNDDFIDFAKAYILTTRKGDAAKTHNRDVAVLRILEAAMMSSGGVAAPSHLTQKHMEKACLILESNYQDTLGMGAALQLLVRHIATNDLCMGLATWTHPFKNKRAPGEAYKPATKLPDDNALLAIAEVFSDGYRYPLSSETIYITGICAIYLSAPMRIGESSWLTLRSLGRAPDSLGKMQSYIDHYSPKTKRFYTKEVPAVMAGHCKEAFRRMEEEYAPARALAKHLESGSEMFFRHVNCPQVAEDQILTQDQLMAALGRKDLTSVRHFLRTITGIGNSTGWTLQTLWPHIVRANLKENPYFPYQLDPRLYVETPPKMSESLICLLSGQLATRETNPVILTANAPVYFHNRTRLQSTNRIKHSFFTKHGFEGLFLTSHQMRHFLNTAADEAGSDIEFITQWSGRASIRQTRDYIHTDPHRAAQKVGARLIPVQEVDPEPITKEEYDVREKGPIITTRYGICMHPWTVSPCEKSADCLNCSELLHCKGHKASLDAVIEERDRVKENLDAALAEIEAGRRAATRWVEQFQKYLERLNSVIAMHNDPSIEDGSPVQMLGKDFSQAKRILAKTGSELPKFSQEYGSDLLDFMKQLVSN